MVLTIITINYNNAEGLRKTLASVASQTYPHIEHIIIDGGSTDGSVEILGAYPQPLPKGKGEVSGDKYPTQNPAHKVLWVSEKDNGIYNAMNKGIEIALGRRVVNSFNRSELVEDKNKGIRVATGDYIQILNSGDILAAPDVTERMMATLAERNEKIHNQQSEQLNNQQLKQSSGDIVNIVENKIVDIVENKKSFSPRIFYGNMIKEYPDGRRVKDTCGGGDYTPESFLYFYRGTLNHDCAYIRHDLFEKYGLYNEQMKICSDWEWYVRAIVLGEEKTSYTDIDVTVFDMMGVSESGGKNRALIQQERREYLESILPASVLRDYDKYAFPIEQYQRLKKYHLWGLAHFIERVLFKLEKWGVLRR